MTNLNELTDLLAAGDLAFGNDDDLAVLFKGNNLGHTVRTAAMIDVTCWAACHRGINHYIVINSEHVDSSILSTADLKI